MSATREQAAAALRERIASVDPELGELIAACKDTFNAKLKYITVPGFEAGNKLEFAREGIVPTAYERGLSGRSLKEAEADHIAAHAPQQARAAARRGAPKGRRARVG